MCVRQWEVEDDGEREGGGQGGISMKESLVVVLTPDASSHCESFCPLWLVSAQLLLMLLLLMRFGMLRRETQKDGEGEKGKDRGKINSVCHLSLA